MRIVDVIPTSHARSMAWVDDRTLVLAGPEGLLWYDVGSGTARQIRTLTGVDAHNVAAAAADLVVVDVFKSGFHQVGHVAGQTVRQARPIPGPWLNSLDVDSLGRVLVSTDQQTCVWPADGDAVIVGRGGMAALCDDGRVLVDSAGSDGVDIVDLGTGRRTTIEDLDQISMEALLYDRSADAVVCGFTSGQVVTIATRNPTLRRQVDHGDRITSVSVAATRLAVLSENGALSLWGRPFGASPPARRTLAPPGKSVTLSPTATWAAARHHTAVSIIDPTG